MTTKTTKPKRVAKPKAEDAVLTAAQILTVDDHKYKKVSVPEWGGTVRLRTISGSDRDILESIMDANAEGDASAKYRDFRARMLSMMIVDEKGKKLFTDKDITVLGGKSNAAISSLFTEALALNKITDADVADIVKN